MYQQLVPTAFPQRLNQYWLRGTCWLYANSKQSLPSPSLDILWSWNHIRWNLFLHYDWNVQSWLDILRSPLSPVHLRLLLVRLLCIIHILVRHSSFSAINIYFRYCYQQWYIGILIQFHSCQCWCNLPSRYPRIRICSNHPSSSSHTLYEEDQLWHELWQWIWSKSAMRP